MRVAVPTTTAVLVGLAVRLRADLFHKRIVKVDIWIEQHIARLIPIPGGSPIYPATGS